MIARCSFNSVVPVVQSRNVWAESTRPGRCKMKLLEIHHLSTTSTQQQAETLKQNNAALCWWKFTGTENSRRWVGCFGLYGRGGGVYLLCICTTETVIFNKIFETRPLYWNASELLMGWSADFGFCFGPQLFTEIIFANERLFLRHSLMAHIFGALDLLHIFTPFEWLLWEQLMSGRAFNLN